MESYEEESTGEVIKVAEFQTAMKPMFGAPSASAREQMQLRQDMGIRSQHRAVGPTPKVLHHCKFLVYPPPLATHAELVHKRELFFNTLTKFHVTLGAKLTIPKIGGKDLDLHVLYREVTARGGLQMVINERKWKEITVVLNVPRTTTSASFVLRKYYINLLHHYEQVHFFQAQGPLVPPPEASYKNAALEDPEVKIKKQKIDSAQALRAVDQASSIGSVVSGFIDGQCEHGYLVTVMVGTRKMRGVVYHVPSPGSRSQGARVSTYTNILQSGFRSTMAHRISSNRKKKKVPRKDPGAPRQNRTGYNFFFGEQRAKLKSIQPDKDRAVSKTIGDLWNKLSEDEKLPYQERGLEDKERYKREMREYKERMRLQNRDSHVNLHMVHKYDHSNSDSRNQVQLKLEESKQLEERTQEQGSQSCSGIPNLEKPSSTSVIELVEKQQSTGGEMTNV
ncbi:high mobility group B protein 9 isoform X1 [Cryptomeria japonica]|uniref:high mobility group B protein 9 isoform X1 n=1 Tax=Cryptomeria japonica TaxID=3369 RepID=UPI0027DA1852|nr:high mobility group B protein 9 isoform X1 [Cryptomeria japonica]